MKNINIPIFAIDFEGSRKIGVVEYGVAIIENGEIARLQTSLCAPKIDIPARDSAFFGIENAEAKKFPPFSESVKELQKMRKVGIFAAHNASVEDNLLRDVMPTPALVPDFSNGRQTSTWSPWLDTCALLKNLYPTLDSAKLSSAIDAFGLKSELDKLAEKFCPPRRRKWHCAPYDALACALLILTICKQDGFEEVDINWLANFSTTRPEQDCNLF